jgi:hypothetical protein
MVQRIIMLAALILIILGICYHLANENTPIEPSFLKNYLLFAGIALIGLSIFFYLQFWRTPFPLAPLFFIAGFSLFVVFGVLVVLQEEKPRVWEYPPPLGEATSQIEKVLEERLPDSSWYSELLVAVQQLSSGPSEESTEHQPSDANLAEIKRILDERLPDTTKQSEFISRLQAVAQTKPEVKIPTPPITPPVKPGLGSFEGILSIGIIVGVVLLGVGLILVFIWLGRREAERTGALGTLLSLGGITLFSICDLTLINLNIEKLYSKTVLPESRFELREFGSIWPFPDAKHVPDDPSIEDSLMRIVTDVHKQSEGDSLNIILIVGGADKRLLGLEAEAMYGSNRGLAQARANWVRLEILRLFKQFHIQIDTTRIITLISGPKNIGTEVLPEKLAEDRSVKVYVGWTMPQRE